eukprot:3087706-Amphidinium_carterae.2
MELYLAARFLHQVCKDLNDAKIAVGDKLRRCRFVCCVMFVSHGMAPFLQDRRQPLARDFKKREPERHVRASSVQAGSVHVGTLKGGIGKSEE